MQTPVLFVVPQVARMLSSAANVMALEIGGIAYAASPPPPPPPPGSSVQPTSISLARGLVIRF